MQRIVFNWVIQNWNIDWIGFRLQLTCKKYQFRLNIINDVQFGVELIVKWPAATVAAPRNFNRGHNYGFNVKLKQ